jgi:gamma-glutamylcysteine synthetase
MGEMSDKKGLGSTVLGWFVVREGEDEQEESPEKIIAKYGKKLPPAPPPPHDEAAPPSLRLQGEIPQVPAGVTPDQRVFTQVYKAAQITDDAQQRVEKELSLLQSLPTETPKEVRKQIVEASLKAFGIPLDQIIETAAEEIQALEAYIQHGERNTGAILTDATQQVARLEAQIAEVKKLMDLQVRTQRGVVKASNDQKLRIQAVLEFFGQEAVARVVRESPKLVEPKG